MSWNVIGFDASIARMGQGSADTHKALCDQLNRFARTTPENALQSHDVLPLSLALGMWAFPEEQRRGTLGALFLGGFIEASDLQQENVINGWNEAAFIFKECWRFDDPLEFAKCCLDKWAIANNLKREQRKAVIGLMATYFSALAWENFAFFEKLLETFHSQ